MWVWWLDNCRDWSWGNSVFITFNWFLCLRYLLSLFLNKGSARNVWYWSEGWFSLIISQIWLFFSRSWFNDLSYLAISFFLLRCALVYILFIIFFRKKIARLFIQPTSTRLRTRWRNHSFLKWKILNSILNYHLLKLFLLFLLWIEYILNFIFSYYDWYFRRLGCNSCTYAW